MERFGQLQEYYWQEYVEQLSALHHPEQIDTSDLALALSKNNFVVRISRESNSELRMIFAGLSLVPRIVKSKILLELCDSPARSKEIVETMSGGMLGEAPMISNRPKICFGVFREQLLFVNDDDDAGTAASAAAAADDNTEFNELKEKRKKIKSKDSILSKKIKSDPNAPQWTRIPLPEMTEAWKQERQSALREICKRLKISQERLPSACFYTLLNTFAGVCSCEITEDSSLLSVGYRDSLVNIFSLSPEPLKPLKPFSELEKLDKDSGIVFFSTD
ncbi:unnamed protein product [Soboliphyme baturini]|uniref:TFIID_NTD2 domain-containing protein n=1 Tax=Soboliphyme baturini TaxID=241478 RepID=A0A183IXV3_9BILA|nr:unnamed protein product [Soboliphyme baturini]